MHFQAPKSFSEKKRLFLKKSSVRFFQKQPLFFASDTRLKMNKYAICEKDYYSLGS